MILTPDQRLRVFVSSTLGELATEREAARRAIERLGLVPVMFEVGARPHPPQALYRAYLEQSHVFVGIYWQRYGWVGPDMDISGLEDEFRLSRAMPRLVYVKGPAPDREPGLARMLHELSDEAQVSYKHFGTPDELEAVLADDLVVLLTEHFAAAEAAAPTTPPTMEIAGLPAELSSFVGREAELAEIRDLLAEDRLVTLTGVGGCGKTRLALRVATGVRDRFPDGVAWVDLAPVADETLVSSALASALGIREMPGEPLADQIVRRLAEGRRLVVLDNCEHLLGGAAELVGRVLRGCPEVTVLATSREPLGTEGEVAWRVPALAVPEAGPTADAEGLGGSDAVRLFVDRANRVHPHFAPTDSNAAVIAEICRRLDGLPLAIELAAARTRMLTPEQIAAGLADRFRLLTGTARGGPTRQQSLRTSVDWSYDLLRDDERALLRRLSVFAGDFTLELAEQVCSGPDLEPDVLDLLAALVDRSLVQVEEHAVEARFRLLQTIREYAEEKLIAAGEEHETRGRHLGAYVALVERLGPDLEGAGLFDALDELDAAIDDLRAALAWAVESGQADRALPVAGSGYHFFILRGHVTDDRRLLGSVVAASTGATSARARALVGCGELAFEGGDVPAMGWAASEALDLARRLDDRGTIARALDLQGYSALYVDPPTSRLLFDQSTALAREVGDWWCVAESRSGRALCEWMAGDIVGAAGAAREAIEAATRCASASELAMAQLFLGMALTWQGELAAARPVLDAALATNRRMRNPLYTALSLTGVVGLAVYEGRYDAARAAAAEMRALAHDYPGTSLQATALYVSGFYELGAEGDLPTAAAHVEESLRAHRAAGMGESPDAVACLHLLGNLARRRGDIDRARTYLDECLERSRALASPWNTAGALNDQALLARAEGDTAGAVPLALEALETSVASANNLRAVDVLETVATLAVDGDRHDVAARLHAAVEAARDAMGYVRFPIDRPDDEALMAQIREALGADELATATVAGAELSVVEAAELARSVGAD